MVSKKVIAILASVIVGLFYHFWFERDDDFHFYYTKGFGTGEISEVMDLYYQHSPKKHKGSWKALPVFVMYDYRIRKANTSYDLLSDTEKKNLGFKNEEEFLNALYAKAPHVKTRSFVGRMSLNGGDEFILVAIGKGKLGNVEEDTYHELYHYLDRYFSYYDTMKVSGNLRAELNKRLGEPELFHSRYMTRHSELMAALHYTYLMNTEMTRKTVSESLQRAVELQKRVERKSIFKKSGLLFYDVNSIISFYRSLEDSDMNENCDFKCLSVKFNNSEVTIDAEEDFLRKNKYFSIYKTQVEKAMIRD